MQLQIHTLSQPKQANGRVASNKHIETTPSPMLAPYVSCFWLSEPITGIQKQGSSKPFESLRENSNDRVLPDGCSDIIFEHDLKKNEFRPLFYGFIDEPLFINKVKIMEEFMTSFMINKPKVDDILINNLLYNIFVTREKLKYRNCPN